MNGIVQLNHSTDALGFCMAVGIEERMIRQDIVAVIFSSISILRCAPEY